MEHLITSFESLARAMAADERFTAVRFKRGAPLKKMDEEAVAACRIRLEPRLMALYREADGFSFSWRLASKSQRAVTLGEEPFTSGEVHLPPFLKTFLSTWKGTLWFEGMGDESDTSRRFTALSKILTSFDVAETTFDGTRRVVFPYDKDALRKASTARKKPKATAPKEEAAASPQSRKQRVEAKLRAIRAGVEQQPPFVPSLWFWDLKGIKFPLDLGLEAYLEQALTTRGLTDWQKLFFDFDALDFADPLTREHLVPYLYTEPPKLRAALGWIGTLFPEVDRAPLEERLARFELRAAALGY